MWSMPAGAGPTNGPPAPSGTGGNIEYTLGGEPWYFSVYFTPTQVWDPATRRWVPGTGVVNQNGSSITVGSYATYHGDNIPINAPTANVAAKIG